MHYLSEVGRRKEALAWNRSEKRTVHTGRSACNEAEWDKALREEVELRLLKHMEVSSAQILDPSAAYWSQQEDSH